MGDHRRCTAFSPGARGDSGPTRHDLGQRGTFDRLLVAQALTEPMRLLTHDAVVAQYSDTVVLV